MKRIKHPEYPGKRTYHDMVIRASNAGLHLSRNNATPGKPYYRLAIPDGDPHQDYFSGSWGVAFITSTSLAEIDAFIKGWVSSKQYYM